MQWVAPSEARFDFLLNLPEATEPLETMNEELQTLNTQARELEATIAENLAEILET